MRMWQFGIIVLIIAMTASVAGHSSQPGEGKESTPEPLAGKIILISTAKSQNTLKNVQVRKLGERNFVVGVVVRDNPLTQEDYPGRTLWLPVSDVVEIVEFDDLAQLRRIGNK